MAGLNIREKNYFKELAREALMLLNLLRLLLLTMPISALPQAIRDNFEIHEWRHATTIFEREFQVEWEDVCDVLSRFRLCKTFIATRGGEKSKVSKWIDSELYKKGWAEKNFDTSVLIDGQSFDSPTHSIDCYKNRIALEIEWNNKDPFFDRDLNNFRLLFDLRVISIGIIVTRCDALQSIFKKIGRGKSYGSSTTHMGKLLPVSKIAAAKSHLYLWVPNALLLEGLKVMEAWGFTYKTNIVWYKVRKDGGPDGRGVGFYFRNVTELLLFGVRGRMRTLQPGRTQVNLFGTRKREHSRKPDEVFDIIESCSPGPYFELFARFARPDWHQWGNEDVEENLFYGVAKRNGHSDERIRLMESPKGYAVK